MTRVEPVAVALSSTNARVVRRFTVPVGNVAFWISAWGVWVAVELWVFIQFLVNGPVAPYPGVLMAFRIAGGLFAACGLVAWRRRPDNHSGRMMTATGFAFLASPLLLQLAWPPLQTAGLLLRNVWLLLLVAIVLTFLSGGRLRTRMDRVLVGTVAGVLLIVAPLSVMFAPSEGNLLLVRPDAQIALTVDSIYRGLNVPLAIIVVGVVAARWLRASGPGRRALVPSVAGSVWLLFFMSVLAAGLVGVRLPQEVFWGLASSVVIVPVAFLAGLLRSRLARGSLVELLRGMRAMHPADLRSALARALGDPALVVAYPGAGAEGLVDGDLGRSPCPPMVSGWWHRSPGTGRWSQR